MNIADPTLPPPADDLAGVKNLTPEPAPVTVCSWCSTPMTGDYNGDGMHAGCGDPIHQSDAVDPETLGPCALCGQITTRYGDAATSTLCDGCLAVTR